MRRHVIVPVDYESATQMDFYLVDEDHGDLTLMNTIPIPPDDQLGQAVEMACRALEMNADFAWSPEQAIDADQARELLRTAFHLDENPRSIRGMAKKHGLPLHDGGQERIDALTGTITDNEEES